MTSPVSLRLIAVAGGVCVLAAAAAALAQPELSPPAAKPASPTVRASVDPDAEGKARELAARGVGRPTIVKETGLKDHIAQKIVREAKAAKEAARA